ncbi:hypothetical protein GCM10023235_56280 [Kitasatospora terrestris]|uniref:Uncharacterized protein n=1 Tax=Kitasatospora terrestris TaxID=258051 RepID=A0ABP9E5Z7_9ACTN
MALPGAERHPVLAIAGAGLLAVHSARCAAGASTPRGWTLDGVRRGADVEETAAITAVADHRVRGVRRALTAH